MVRQYHKNLLQNTNSFLEQQMAFSFEFSVKEGSRWSGLSRSSNLDQGNVYRCRVKVYRKHDSDITNNYGHVTIHAYQRSVKLHGNSRLADDEQSRIYRVLLPLNNNRNNTVVTFYFRVTRTLSPHVKLFETKFDCHVDPRGEIYVHASNMKRNGR